MWIDTLKLRDFRGFRELDLDLRRQLTVLIGVNGSGKSTIVDALGLLGAMRRRISRDDFSYYMDWVPKADDIRGDSSTCRIECEFGDERLSLGAEREKRWSDSATTMSVPSIVCLTSRRSAHVTWSLREEEGAIADDGFEDFSDPHVSAFQRAAAWFREREDLENQSRVERRSFEYEEPALSAARRALRALLPEVEEVRVDRGHADGPSLVVRKDDAVFSAELLSDGERSLLVMALTIVRRLELADGTQELAQRKATIVIDEVELHLHPKWQRVVVPRLLAAFPNCQFIVTTHSPQVIGSVELDSVFVLEDFQVVQGRVPTKGRDSNAILEEVMDASARDPDTETELDQAARLVEVGSDAEAEAAVQKLAERFGEDDREVVRLRTALMLRGA